MYRVVTRLGEGYEQEHLDQLVKSCEQFGLEVSVGTSNESRATLILEETIKTPEVNILYLEPGSVVRIRPDLFENPSFDIGAFVFRMDFTIPTDNRFRGIGWIHPWTLFFRHSPASIQVLSRWVKANTARPDRKEAQNLLFFLAEEDVPFKYLPVEYGWVDRLMAPICIEAKPVIEHLAKEIPNAPARLSPNPKRYKFMRSFSGLGDTFYMRPAVKKYLEKNGEFYLENPWPQFWTDLPSVKVLKPILTTLRVQQENVKSTPEELWAERPKSIAPSGRYLQYASSDFQAGRTPVQAFMSNAAVSGTPTVEEYHFPVPLSWITSWMVELEQEGKPIGIVRPPTIRKEWANASRNPKAEYFQRLIDTHPEFRWFEVGWESGDAEVVDGDPLTGVEKGFNQGKLSTEELAAFISVAEIALCPPCFMLPMAAAIGTPTFCIFGGSVGPDLLVEPCMGRVGFAAPDPFCNCFMMDHQCKKDIPFDRLEKTFSNFLSGSP